MDDFRPVAGAAYFYFMSPSQSGLLYGLSRDIFATLDDQPKVKTMEKTSAFFGASSKPVTTVDCHRNLRSDDGSEFTSRSMLSWTEEQDPWGTMQDGDVRSFHRTTA